MSHFFHDRALFSHCHSASCAHRDFELHEFCAIRVLRGHVWGLLRLPWCAYHVANLVQIWWVWLESFWSYHTNKVWWLLRPRSWPWRWRSRSAIIKRVLAPTMMHIWCKIWWMCLETFWSYHAKNVMETERWADRRRWRQYPFDQKGWGVKIQ